MKIFKQYSDTIFLIENVSNKTIVKIESYFIFFYMDNSVNFDVFSIKIQYLK